PGATGTCPPRSPDMSAAGPTWWPSSPATYETPGNPRSSQVWELVLVKISGRYTEPAAASPVPSATESSPVVQRGRVEPSVCSAGLIARVPAAAGVAVGAVSPDVESAVESDVESDVDGSAGVLGVVGGVPAHAAAPIST